MKNSLKKIYFSLFFLFTSTTTYLNAIDWIGVGSIVAFTGGVAALGQAQTHEEIISTETEARLVANFNTTHKLDEDKRDEIDHKNLSTLLSLYKAAHRLTISAAIRKEKNQEEKIARIYKNIGFAGISAGILGLNFISGSDSDKVGNTSLAAFLIPLAAEGVRSRLTNGTFNLDQVAGNTLFAWTTLASLRTITTFIK